MKKYSIVALLPILALVFTSVASAQNDGGYSGWQICSGGWYLIWIGWWHFTGIPC